MRYTTYTHSENIANTITLKLTGRYINNIPPLLCPDRRYFQIKYGFCDFRKKRFEYSVGTEHEHAIVQIVTVVRSTDTFVVVPITFQYYHHHHTSNGTLYKRHGRIVLS